MIRSLSLAALLSAGLAMPAFAAEDASAQSGAADPAVFAAQLTSAAHAKQARQILIGRGYTQVSDLSRSENGYWTGSAVKNGKVTAVSVKLPPNLGSQGPATN